MSINNIFFTTTKLTFSYCLRILSYLIPKKNNLWIFIGWHRDSNGEVLADNSKYFFLQTQGHSLARAVWIAHDKSMAEKLNQQGLESYQKSSIRGIWVAMRAEVTVVDSHMKVENWRCSGGTTLVQLWHGKGFKKVAKVSEGGVMTKNSFLHPHLYVKYDYLIASSEYTAKMMAEAFEIPIDRVLITGLPRTDVFFKNIKGATIDVHPELKSLLDKSSASEKLLLYAPTFRRYEYDPFHLLHESSLVSYLEQNNIRLVVTLHPKYAKLIPKESGLHPRITVLAAGYDMYPYLDQFDAIITDYGSSFIEFLLLDKHIVFYVPDLNKYSSSLYEDYYLYTPGPKITSADQVSTALSHATQWQSKRQEVREVFFKYKDGDAADRLLATIKSKINT